MSNNTETTAVAVHVDNIRLLSRTLRSHPKQFNLNSWAKHVDTKGDGVLRAIPSPLQDCGTICCICGFANALAAAAREDNCGIPYSDIQTAAKFLGLPFSFASALFMPQASLGRSVHMLTLDPQDPWRQAAYAGVIHEYDNIYSLPADTVADMLDAIACGRITVCCLDSHC